MSSEFSWMSGCGRDSHCYILLCSQTTYLSINSMLALPVTSSWSTPTIFSFAHWNENLKYESCHLLDIMHTCSLHTRYSGWVTVVDWILPGIARSWTHPAHIAIWPKIRIEGCLAKLTWAVLKQIRTNYVANFILNLNVTLLFVDDWLETDLLISGKAMAFCSDWNWTIYPSCGSVKCVSPIIF